VEFDGSVIATGPLFQVCWVVADLDAAEQEFTHRYGVARWLRINDVAFSADHCSVRGVPTDYVIHVSIAYAGDQQVELIQPVTGHNIYAEFLDAHGPGLHHVAYVVEDLPSALERARAAGADVVQQGGFGALGMDFAYVSSTHVGGFVELMQLSAHMRALFDDLVPAGHRNPWQ
jgi:hypothetical protein